MIVQLHDANFSLNIIHGEGVVYSVICKSVTRNIGNTTVTRVAHPIIRVMHFVKKHGEYSQKTVMM